MGNVALEVGPADLRVTAWLRAYLEYFGVTQTKLARAIDMSETRMSRRMSGQLPWSNADVERIAKYLEVDENDIRNGPVEE